MVILFSSIPIRNKNTGHPLRDKLKSLQKLFVFVQFLRVIFEVDDVSALILSDFSKNHVNIQIRSLLNFRSYGHVCY